MHVLMIFQRKAENVFQNIHDDLGEWFLVDLKNQLFIVQAL